MIRWLHISDLHIQDRADWNNYRKELLTKCSGMDKIDLVIVTGDFHNFSDGEDFERARIFLQELMRKLNLDISKDLFLVPGNHDGVTNIPDKDLYITAAQSKPLSMKKQWLAKLLEMFSGYELFVKKLIPNYPVEHPAEAHCRIWRDKINFIHCNTAIAADGHTKENQLLDVDGMASLVYSDSQPNIILAHNNFGDLHPDVQKRVKDIIRTHSVRAYLCGDRHIESAEQISYENKQNRQIPCIGCYKSAPDAADGYSRFGIIVGEWQGETANLKGWYWTSGDGFKIDGNITEQIIYMGLCGTPEQLSQKKGVPAQSLNIDSVMPEKPFLIHKSNPQESRWTHADCMMEVEGDMEISFVSFSKEEQFVIAGSNDGTIKIWELSTGKHIRTFRNTGKEIIEKIEDAVLLPNGRLGVLHRVAPNSLSYSSQNHKYSELDIKTGESVRTSYIGNIHMQFINPCLSDDGANVISWCDVPIQYGKSSSMYIFSTHDSGDFFLYNYRHYAPVSAVSRNGSTGIAADLDSEGLYYNEWREESELRTIQLSVICVKGNKMSASPSYYTEYTFNPQLKSIWHIAVSSDGELAIISGLVSGRPFITMNLLSIRQKKYLARINTSEKNCDKVIISSDNSLALYQNQNSFSIWSLPDGQQLGIFSHPEMKCINFSESGKYAISVAKDNTIKIWR